MSRWEEKAQEKKNTSLNGNRTYDLCESDTVLYQLRYEGN